ncbi:MAG TPA: glycosyltransferase, partial [Syntrophorhabdaceae bacterium]
MITYNHEEFIEKALDSILMQNTNFDYEVVVGEDCSTDNTRDILIKYKQRYPEKFVLLLNEHNLGMHRNMDLVLKTCRGEYVAFLEGDDYWVSPRKLQKQVDLLDAHPECVLCAHNVSIVQDENISGKSFWCPADMAERLTIEDLLLDNLFPTCSVVIRTDLIRHLPDWINNLPMRDWPIYILALRHGNAIYINEVMGVYVIHRGGVWFGANQDWKELEKRLIPFYKAIYSHLDQKCQMIIDHIVRHKLFALSLGYENTGDMTEARRYAFESLVRHFITIADQRRFGRTGYDIPAIPDYM